MLSTVAGKEFNRTEQNAATEQLARSMSADHLVQVYEDLHQHYLWEQRPFDQRGKIEPAFSHLTEVFLHLIHFTMEDDTHLLALPTEVAEIYLKHSNAWPTDECQTCGYRMPYVAGDWLGYCGDDFDRSPRRFFEECALCGAKITQSHNSEICAMYAN